MTTQPPVAPGAPAHVTHPTLTSAMRAVLGENLYVQKKGYNEQQSYSFARESDFLDTIRPLLAHHGVILTESYVFTKDEFGERPPSFAGKPPRPYHYVAILGTFTFRHVDSSETITTAFPGTGMDSGDKAIYKAMTGALKYCLRQTFLVATGDDPEATEPVKDSHDTAATAPPPAEEPKKRTYTEVFTEALSFLGDVKFREAYAEATDNRLPSPPGDLVAAALDLAADQKKALVAALRARA